jgi:hypothetical protein
VFKTVVRFVGFSVLLTTTDSIFALLLYIEDMDWPMFQSGWISTLGILVCAMQLNTLKAKLGERASRRAASRKAQGSVDGNHEATASTDGGGGGGGSMSGAEGEGSDAAGLSPREEPLQQEGVEPDIINLDAAAEPLEEEVKAEMGVMFGGGASEVDPTIFAVTMACIDPQYEGQTLEFLQHGGSIGGWHVVQCCAGLRPCHAHLHMSVARACCDIHWRLCTFLLSCSV